MHIPDGFLTPQVWLPLEGLAIGVLGFSSYKLKLKEKEGIENAIMLGALGGFVFSSQMINIPIPGGTSGHLIGTMLLGLAVGPWATLLVIGAILLIQALLFQDGGITAWGANFFNMGVINLLIGYGGYKLLKMIIKSERFDYILIGIFSWLGVIFASLSTALELILSGLGNWKLILTAMLGWHIVIGIIEGIGTVIIWKFIKRVIKEKNFEFKSTKEATNETT